MRDSTIRLRGALLILSALIAGANTAGKESNWVPTSATGGFDVLFRFYGPEEPLLR